MIDLPPETEQALQADWTKYGVELEVQASLIEKMERGLGIDAMSGASPTSSESQRKSSRVEVVNTFADGSISVFNFELPAKPQKGTVTPNAVSGCSGGGTTNTYTNCAVTGSFGGVSLGFRAGYTLSASGNARINSWAYPTAGSLPGILVTAPTFEVIRQNQSGSLAAQVNLTTQWSYVGIGGGATTRLEFRVRNMQAYTN